MFLRSHRRDFEGSKCTRSNVSSHSCLIFHPFVNPSHHSLFKILSVNLFIHLFNLSNINPIRNLSSYFIILSTILLLIYPTIHSIIHPTIHSTIHPTIHSTIHPTIHSTIHPTIHSTIHPTIHLTIHSTIQTFIHSAIHPSTYSSINLPSIHLSTHPFYPSIYPPII